MKHWFFTYILEHKWTHGMFSTALCKCPGHRMRRATIYIGLSLIICVGAILQAKVLAAILASWLLINYINMAVEASTARRDMEVGRKLFTSIIESLPPPESVIDDDDDDDQKVTM
jgi:hypothetical protein